VPNVRVTRGHARSRFRYWCRMMGIAAVAVSIAGCPPRRPRPVPPRRCRPAAGLGMALAAVAVQARTLVNHERRAHHRRL
jgi:hypothetical protein